MANDTLSDKFSALSTREKRGLIAMAVILPMLAMIVVVGLFSRSLTDIEDQTRTYQQSLDLLASAGPTYVKNKSNDSDNAMTALFPDEVLKDNPVRLTGFIAARAKEAGVEPSSYDTENIPLGSTSGDDSGPIIIEKKVQIDIRKAQIDDFLTFLEAIETSGEPVVIKRIDLRGNSHDPGQVRARVEVSTFIKKKQTS